jgi:hypothetical protein
MVVVIVNHNEKDCDNACASHYLPFSKKHILWPYLGKKNPQALFNPNN